MERTITLPQKSSPSLSIKKCGPKPSYAGLVYQQMRLTLGILSLSILLLVLGTPSWLTLALAMLLIFIQLILYLQTLFFSSTKFDLELDSDEVKEAIHKDIYLKE